MTVRTVLASRSRSQAGTTLVELVVASFLCMVVVGLAAAFLISNLRSYAEIKGTLAMQNNLKHSLQAMTRQISNAGGWLPDPRGHFKPEAGRITFAYFDVEAKYCSTPDTVIASFYLAGSQRSNSLVEEHFCVKGERRLRTLAEPPVGGSLGLKFTYLDMDGSVTTDAAKMKAVRLEFDQKLPRHGATTSIARSQTLQVELVNL